MWSYSRPHLLPAGPRALSRDVRPGLGDRGLRSAGDPRARQREPTPARPPGPGRAAGGNINPPNATRGGGIEAISVLDAFMSPPPRSAVPAGFVRGHLGRSGPIAALQSRGGAARGRGGRA